MNSIIQSSDSYILYNIQEIVQGKSTGVSSIHSWDLGSVDGLNPYSLDIVSAGAICCAILVISTNNPVLSVLFLIALFINIAIYLILIGITFIGLTYIVVYIGAVTILFLFVIMLLNIKLSEIQSDNNNNNLPIGMIVAITFWIPVLYHGNNSSGWTLYFEKFSSGSQFSQSEKGSARGKDFLSSPEVFVEGNRNRLLTGPQEASASFPLQEASPLNTKNIENLLISKDTEENLIQDYIFNKNESLSINPIFEQASFSDNILLDKALSNWWDTSLFTYTQVSSIGHVMYSSHFIWFILVSLILLLSMLGAISLTLKN